MIFSAFRISTTVPAVTSSAVERSVKITREAIPYFNSLFERIYLSFNDDHNVLKCNRTENKTLNLLQI
ncbi:MAG: hypothetical protein DRP62_02830 [Planctomycetota bacterium]|nr:MAG: hypothetical protein DRP62_02830 [Planctomycetota bacterium]